MALIPCPSCSRSISTEATSCPGCGHPLTRELAAAQQRELLKQKQDAKNGALGCLVMVGLLAGAITYCSSSDTEQQRPAVARQNQIAGDGHFGCISRETNDQLTRYTAQGDQRAFSQVLSSAYASGACTRFRAGEPVVIMGTAGFLASSIRVRRAGEVTEYWTVREAVK